ncbi:MAG: RagB/SusD family nutrient uptake outer membrane protein [Chitinophagaceae bacterium]
MKTKLFILTFLIIALGLTSCKKFLTQLPEDSISPETYYNTPVELTSALMSVYSSLSNTNESTYSRFLTLEASCSTDEMVRPGSAVSPGTYNSSSAYPAYGTCWSTIYAAIDRANLLLEKIPGSPAPIAVKNEIKGEALFLRAYYYFMLVNLWGDVPLRLKSTSGIQDVSSPRVPQKEIYEKIIADMIEAEPLVNPIATWGHNGRISTTGVDGILARVCLHAAGRLNDPAYYPKARAWALKVITSGSHSLNPDYKQIFINQSADLIDIQESIWEVEFYSNSGTTFSANSERFGSSLGIRNDIATTGFMQGNITQAMTGYYYSLFKKEDLRRDWTIPNFAYIGNDISKGIVALPLTAPATTATIWGRSLSKWRRSYQPAYSIVNKNGGCTNWPLLRYADVLLMFAEADNEISGPSDASIGYINQVRERAFGKALNGKIVTTFTVTDGGSGYPNTSATVAGPAVTITGGGASRSAVATATVVGGKVTEIAIVDVGANYTSVPTVTIAAPTTGVRATATASLLSFNSTLSNFPSAASWSQATLREAIRIERSLELGGEGLRKWDLIRWGTLLTTASDMKDIVVNGKPAFSVGPLSFPATVACPTNIRANTLLPYSNATIRDVVFPIPIDELIRNPGIPNSAQNTGW